MSRPMRNWLRLSEAADLVGMRGRSGSTTTFEDAVARGDYAGVLTKQVGRETRWCAEALWMAHVQGHTDGCDELATIQAFVADYPLPDDEAGAA